MSDWSSKMRQIKLPFDEKSHIIHVQTQGKHGNIFLKQHTCNVINDLKKHICDTRTKCLALFLIAFQLSNPEVVVRRMNDPHRGAYTAPLITGSLFRYVAQYTRLKVPNSTGNTILDILSILLTLL